MRPDELEDATGLSLPDGDYETIAGFILERLGRLARRGDQVSVKNWILRVANVGRRRILSVDVMPPANVPPQVAEEAGEAGGAGGASPPPGSAPGSAPATKA